MSEHLIRGNKTSSLKAMPKEIAIAKPFPKPDGKRARFTGGVSLTCNPNQSVTGVFVVPQEGRWITGAEYEAINRTFGDYVDFEIHHPDPQVGMVDDFVQNWFVFDKPKTYQVYPAWLPGFMEIHVTYNSVGGTDPAQFAINFFLHFDELKV